MFKIDFRKEKILKANFIKQEKMSSKSDRVKQYHADQLENINGKYKRNSFKKGNLLSKPELYCSFLKILNRIYLTQLFYHDE